MSPTIYQCSHSAALWITLQIVLLLSRLQANAPDAYAVFNLGGDAGKTAAQGLKVMTFIDGLVKGLDDMGGVKASIDTLGGRHTSYGAKKAHFGVSEYHLNRQLKCTFE